MEKNVTGKGARKGQAAEQQFDLGRPGTRPQWKNLKQIRGRATRIFGVEPRTAGRTGMCLVRLGKCNETRVPGARGHQEAAGPRLKGLSLAFALSVMGAIGGLCVEEGWDLVGG